MWKAFSESENVDRGVSSGHLSFYLRWSWTPVPGGESWSENSVNVQLFPSCLYAFTSCCMHHFILTNHGIFVGLVHRSLTPSVQHFRRDMPCVSYRVHFLFTNIMLTPRIMSNWKFALLIALIAFTRNLSLNTAGRNGK